MSAKEIVYTETSRNLILREEEVLGIIERGAK